MMHTLSLYQLETMFSNNSWVSDNCSSKRNSRNLLTNKRIYLRKCTHHWYCQIPHRSCVRLPLCTLLLY
ncbi:unnamed protein product [Trichobilharzia szidati]|nr:unnamed protein product [Trichobilharzia szidati]